MKKLVPFALVLMLLLNCLVIPAAMAEERIQLRVEVFDRSTPGLDLENGWQQKYVNEHFSSQTNIDVKFVPISRWQETDLITTLMAGQTAPDIVITYGDELVSQFVDMGGTYQLDELLKDAPNLTAFLGEDVLRFGQKDMDGDGVKEQWTLNARRASVGNVGMFIRQDWLDKLGLAMPTNLEELENFCRLAKENNLGGANTYPLFYDLFENKPMFNTMRFTDCFIDFSKVTEEDWFVYSSNHEMLPGSKDGFRWLNKMYNEGLLYEGFAIADDATTKSNMVNGFLGTYYGQPTQVWGGADNYEGELEKNVGGQWKPLNCYANIYDGRTRHDVYNANGLHIFIPSWVSEETAKAAIKYLDWLAQYDNLFAMYFGTEGINYESINEEGIVVGPKTNDEIPDEYKVHGVDVAFITNGFDYGTPEKNEIATALSYPGYEEDVATSIRYSLTDTWAQTGFTVPIQAYTDYSAGMVSKQAEMIAAVITCAPEAFDTVFDSYIQEIIDAGATEIMEGYREAYYNNNYYGSFPE